MKYNLIPLVIFCFLQVCDLVSTSIVLYRKGVIEGNTYLNNVMKRIGMHSTLFFSKVAMIIGAIAAQYYYPSTYLLVAFSLASIWYLWVVINNFKLR